MEERSRENNVPFFADAHAEHSGVPPLDHLADAEGEVKRFVAVNRGIELKNQTTKFDKIFVSVNGSFVSKTSKLVTTCIAVGFRFTAFVRNIMRLCSLCTCVLELMNKKIVYYLKMQSEFSLNLEALSSSNVASV